VLFEAHFTKLADGQFLNAFAWAIASLQDADGPRTRVKEQGCSPRPTQDILALVGALELLSAADKNGVVLSPRFRIRILEGK
jgi:hypothetical protein